VKPTWGKGTSKLKKGANEWARFDLYGLGKTLKELNATHHVVEENFGEKSQLHSRESLGNSKFAGPSLLGGIHSELGRGEKKTKNGGER